MSSNTYSNTVRPVQQIIAQLSYMKNNTTQIITVDKNKYSIDTRIASVKCTNDKGKEIQAILPELHKGDKLIFVHETQNEYDKNTIKAICDYQCIGYIKSELTEKIAPLMDYGRIPKGIITEIIANKNDKSYDCKIHIKNSLWRFSIMKDRYSFIAIFDMLINVVFLMQDINKN